MEMRKMKEMSFLGIAGRFSRFPPPFIIIRQLPPSSFSFSPIPISSAQSQQFFKIEFQEKFTTTILTFKYVR